MTYQNLQGSEDGSDESNLSADFASADASNHANSTDLSGPLDDKRGDKGNQWPGWLSGPEGLLVGLGIGLIIIPAVGWLSNLRSQPDATGAAETEQVASASVTTAQPETRPIRQTITTNGTVEAFDLLSVSPRASGLQIQSVNVREGDRVTAGQTLAVLDDSVLQSEIDQAEAQVNAAIAEVASREAQAAQARAALAEAQENFDRYNRLFEQGAISSEELTRRRTEVASAQQNVSAAVAAIDSAEATVRSQQASVDRNITQLDQTLVVAPSSGVIAEKSATVGDTASAGAPLFKIIDGDQLELAVSIPQAQMAKVNVGTQAQITSDSDADLQLQGTVSSIDPTVDAQTRQATVNVRLPGSDRLRPGMFLNAAIVTGTRQGIVIPAEALLPQASGGFVVYTVETGEDDAGKVIYTAKANAVDVGDRLPVVGDTPARVEITSGLTVDDTVVVTGASYLQNGDTVNVVDSNAGSSSFVSEENN